MPRYRKRPVDVEAIQVPPPITDDNIGLHGMLGVWLELHCNGRDWRVANEAGEVDIETLEGVMRARNGDWIIQGVKGEIYPCKPDIFAATYELAELA